MTCKAKFLASSINSCCSSSDCTLSNLEASSLILASYDKIISKASFIPLMVDDSCFVLFYNSLLRNSSFSFKFANAFS